MHYIGVKPLNSFIFKLSFKHAAASTSCKLYKTFDFEELRPPMLDILLPGIKDVHMMSCKVHAAALISQA